MLRCFRRRFRRLCHTVAAMTDGVSKPCFFCCLLPASASGFLPALLLLWRAVWFPAAVPDLWWWLFLPLWLLFSCILPALTASAVLSSRRAVHDCMLGFLCTVQLLLAHSWALCVLYGFPALLLSVISLTAAAVCLLSLPHAFRFADGAAVLCGAGALWDLYLTVLWLLL